jgi:hypothetical protein
LNSLRTLLAALPALLALGISPAAFAHSTSTSFISVDLPTDENPVELRWDLSIHDIVWTVFIDRDFDGAVTWGEVQAASANIERSLLHEISVSRGGTPCALALRDLALADRVEQHYLSTALTATCPAHGALSIGGSLYMSGDASQRVLVSGHRGGESLTGVISATSGNWVEPERVSAWSSFFRFIREGVWHVAIGYDHIAFVLLLLLPSVLRPVDGRWQGASRLSQVTRDIVTIITAFTIAHSTTLALAVTGTVKLPTQPIEIAIAASIAIAGAINLLPSLSKLRLPLAFSFGFVHGFGFANALREIDAAGTALLPLLAGFNIGVEVAQLAIVALVLPLIYSIRQTRWYAGGLMPLGSCALGAAGLVWMFQRI